MYVVSRVGKREGAIKYGGCILDIRHCLVIGNHSNLQTICVFSCFVSCQLSFPWLENKRVTSSGGKRV